VKQEFFIACRDGETVVEEQVLTLNLVARQSRNLPYKRLLPAKALAHGIFYTNTSPLSTMI
jgi:hypothetical protein